MGLKAPGDSLHGLAHVTEYRLLHPKRSSPDYPPPVPIALAGHFTSCVADRGRQLRAPYMTAAGLLIFGATHHDAFASTTKSNYKDW
ncbi:hypothetical protein N7539_002755 [Penicillium diatomitis]|uniref:Uncharacterized protein n=1 Tax=Penicillium diatomitis TaxID=2819901 RepID=A0A9X0BZE1_9EURO|nr:uncharacterized protein N7539_002755 [Penicillium diatomitis]KAJ5491188.1 hypothetical protein N7539_002755 [Penicillium diatomitis]